MLSNFSTDLEPEIEAEKILSLLHKTIKKVQSDIESFSFNTAVSALMIFVNECTAYKQTTGKLPLNKDNLKIFIKILAPFAPHLSEEIWQILGEKTSVFKSSWPEFSEDLAKDKLINLPVQVNGKLRAILVVEAGISEEDAIRLAFENEKVKTYVAGKELSKKIFVYDKLISLVVK